MNFSQKPKIGLALSGGGARGLAHIGVIKVLEKNGIPIDFIAGSSIGALVGGLYAATKDIAYVEEVALGTNWRKMVELIDPAFGNGFLTGDKVQDFIRHSLKGGTFEKIKIPLAVVATDIKNGTPIIFKDGDLAHALRASISMPFVFHVVANKDQALCDGDLSMPIPVSVVREMGAEYVIAVDLESEYFKENRGKIGTNLGDMGQDVVMLLATHLAKENLAGADFTVAPDVKDVKWMEFFSEAKTKEIITRGERAMTEALPKLFAKSKEKPKSFWQRAKDVLFMKI